jgi:outer membrane biosynthesis protein TonB
VRRAWLIYFLALLPACAVHRKPALPPPIASESREGRTSVRVLATPDTPRPPEKSEVTILDAEAGSENQLPEYPQAALQQGCGAGVVPIRIHIGSSGRVIRQADVPGRVLAADSCHLQFEEAVRAAVSQWGFFPAMQHVCAEGGCTDTPITIYLDLEFRFDVVHGKGRVRAP